MSSSSSILHNRSSLSSRSNIPPPKWINAYGYFIIHNSGLISHIESALRSITYLLSGRFRDSELVAESLYSSIRLLTLYHDTLLNKAIQRFPSSKLPIPSPHNRYTSYYCRNNGYRRLAYSLQFIQFTELLWEMASKRKSHQCQHRVVVFIEFLKALCRLMILRITQSRSVLTLPIPNREIDPIALEKAKNIFEMKQFPKQSRTTCTSNDDDANSSSTALITQDDSPDLDDVISDSDTWTMPRTGLSLPSLPDSSNISSYLQSKIVKPDDIRPPQNLVHSLNGSGELAEMIYILRPLIYALILYRFRHNRSNWTPWVAGLAMELIARHILKTYYQESSPLGLNILTSLEKDEYMKRKYGMIWWILRGAFYENITRPWIKSVSAKLNNKPIIGMAGSMLDNYDYLWREYYFSTSTI